MRKALVIIFGILFYASQATNAQSVRWTSFDHLKDSLRADSRPLLIFIHTDWCKFCKMQENFTFRDKQVVDRLNEKFYCLKLNAESRAKIDFINRNYEFNVTDGHHELANFLGRHNNELVFPTTVIVDQSLFGIKRLTGYQSAELLVPELTGFL